MYFNKERWKWYNKYRPLQYFTTCHAPLLGWFYYITHTEEEIWFAEKEMISELCEFIAGFCEMDTCNGSNLSIQ